MDSRGSVGPVPTSLIHDVQTGLLQQLAGHQYHHKDRRGNQEKYNGNNSITSVSRVHPLEVMNVRTVQSGGPGELRLPESRCRGG